MLLCTSIFFLFFFCLRFDCSLLLKRVDRPRELFVTFSLKRHPENLDSSKLHSYFEVCFLNLIFTPKNVGSWKLSTLEQGRIWRLKDTFFRMWHKASEKMPQHLLRALGPRQDHLGRVFRVDLESWSKTLPLPCITFCLWFLAHVVSSKPFRHNMF